MPEQVTTATHPAIPVPREDTGNTEDTDDLAATLRSSTTRFVRRLRVERPGHELTMTQISVLFSLSNAGSLTPRQLAAIERVQPPAITRTVAVLEERGLVQRTPHPTDGRQVVLSPTSAGQLLVDDDRRAREAWLARRLAELPATEREALRTAAAILDRLARA
jgi:DNA-binding MarR family transcriptional regulator